MNLKQISLKFRDKLKKIKVVCLDVDGILTDGRVFYQGEEMGFNRYFNVYDGYGMKVLKEAGLKVGVITGGNSLSVTKRSEQLQLDFCYMGNEDKRVPFLDIMKKYNVSAEEVLYMGDELFDIPLLKKAGFSATVTTASDEVKESVDYVTERLGGHGAVREVMDLVRYAQNIQPHIPTFES